MKLARVSTLSALPVVAATAILPSAAFAAGETSPVEQMQAQAITFVTALGVMAVAVALAMLGVKLVPVAFKWVGQFLAR